MSSEETIAGNQLIAEFIGMKYDSNTDVWEDDKNAYGVHSLEYHTSWDWLMPLVEKIGSIQYRFNVNINSFDGCCIYDDDYKSTASGKIFNGGINGTFIQSVYRAVILFIKWYNESQQKNPLKYITHETNF